MMAFSSPTLEVKMSKNPDSELAQQLPKSWPTVVKSAVLHAIGLSQFALTRTRANSVDS